MIDTELIVVMAPSVSAPTAPQNHAYPNAPVFWATVAVTEPVGPVTETVAFADFHPAPPPNVSDEKSAFTRVICAWMPPAIEPLYTASYDRATQITEKVLLVASVPPEVEAASVGVAV